MDVEGGGTPRRWGAAEGSVSRSRGIRRQTPGESDCRASSKTDKFSPKSLLLTAGVGWDSTSPSSADRRRLKRGQGQCCPSLAGQLPQPLAQSRSGADGPSLRGDCVQAEALGRQERGERDRETDVENVKAKPQTRNPPLAGKPHTAVPKHRGQSSRRGGPRQSCNGIREEPSKTSTEVCLEC